MKGFITYKSLLDYGVSENTIKTSCKNYRSGKITSWINIPDPKDRRKVLIDLDSIPPQTRKKHNIPTAQQYIEQKKVEEFKKAEKQQKDVSNQILNELRAAYEEEFYPFIELYSKYLPDTANGISQSDRIFQFAREHAFFLKGVELSGGGLRAVRFSLEPVWEAYEILKKELVFHRHIQYYSHFSKKVNNIRKAAYYQNDEELVRLVAGGNALRKYKPLKAQKFHKGLAMLYLSNPKKISHETVAVMINNLCVLEGKDTISRSWVTALMKKGSSFRTLVNEKRNGKKAFSDTHEGYLPRIAAAFPGNIWQADGTPLQFYCYNEARTKVIRLNLYVIIDVCSRKIVGFDLAISEDRFTIMSTVQMAVQLQGHTPKEIVSDNFSANKTEELKEMQSLMQEMGTIWRKATVGNSQDKGQVERWFGTFQSEFCALCDDYLGEGITSKREHGKRDPEFLAEVRKKRGYPTVDEMHERISSLIAKYNDTERINGQTPNEIYTNFPKPEVRELNAWQMAKLFWKATKHTIGRSMVRLVVRKQKYHYEIPTEELKLQLHKETVTVRYDETDLSTVMLFDRQTDEVICECKQIVEVSMDDIGETEAATKAMLIHEAKKKKSRNYREKRRNEIIAEGMEEGEKSLEEYAGTDPLSLDKYNRNSRESMEMQDYYRQRKNLTQLNNGKSNSGTGKRSKSPLNERDDLMKSKKTAPFKPEAVK